MVDGGLFCSLFVLVMVRVACWGGEFVIKRVWVLCCLVRVVSALVACGLLVRVLSLLRG